MIRLILGLALFGFIVYIVITQIKMPDLFVIAVILVVLYLIQLFGLDMPIPKLH